MATTKPKPDSDKPAKCKPFSVSVTISPDDKQINFGLTKGCNADNSAFWTIDFILKVKKGTEMKTRVEVHVVLGKDQEKAKAEAVAQLIKDTKKLSDEMVDRLTAEVTDRALEVKPKDAQKDPELRALLVDILS